MSNNEFRIVKYLNASIFCDARLSRHLLRYSTFIIRYSSFSVLFLQDAPRNGRAFFESRRHRRRFTIMRIRVNYRPWAWKAPESNLMDWQAHSQTTAMNPARTRAFQRPRARPQCVQKRDTPQSRRLPRSASSILNPVLQPSRASG